MKTERLTAEEMLDRYLDATDVDVNRELMCNAMRAFATQELRVKIKEEYERGVADGKVIQEHGSTNYIE
jgi:hypothetical protein